MNPLAKCYWIAKGVGWDNVPRRLLHAFHVRSGVLRRRLDTAFFRYEVSPIIGLDEQQLANRWRGRVDRFLLIPISKSLRCVANDELWQSSVTKVCEKTLAGEYQYFSHWFGRLGWPPNFNRDPLHDLDWPVGQHWLGTARSGPPRDDIKLAWEASRLTAAYYLARQFARSRDERWAAAFWEMLDAWIEQNPVNESVAWGCGQECAFRIMAALTGAITTLESTAASPERLCRLELLCWQTGKRIEANINYALSQKNNHGISEALGLWTIGVICSELPEAGRWKQMGERLLVAEVGRQVYEDGSFVQNSMSYHRVMLDDLCWFMALSRRNQLDVPRVIQAKGAKATEWLSNFVDSNAGRVPNYGANDGANVLPLSCSDYLDYRPTLQASAELFGAHDVSVGRGPWDEKTLWLTGGLPQDDTRLERKRLSVWQAKQGGYHILRGPNSHAFIRATTHRDRPGQCDMLHLDLWHAGYNIARDSGSHFYYHRDKAEKDYYYSSRAHNVPVVDGTEQMIKGPNFLWFNWPKTKCLHASETELAFKSTFRDYRHFRQISRDEDTYRIEDKVDGVDSFELVWHLTPELEWAESGNNMFCGTDANGVSSTLMVESSGLINASLSDADESLYYGSKRKTPLLRITGVTQGISTTFLPEPYSSG